MRRMIAFLTIVLVLFGSLVTNVAAQMAPLEEGTKVEKEDIASKAVPDAAKTWAKLASSDEPAETEAALNAVSEGLRFGPFRGGLETVVVSPFKVIRTSDVRVLSDGRYTVEIAFTGGFGLEHQYSTQRWVFVLNGESYLLDDFRPSEREKPLVPSKWTQQTLDTTLTGGVLAFADGSTSIEVEATDLVWINSASVDGPTPVGLFQLHEGVTPAAGLTLDSIDLIGGLQMVGPSGFAHLDPGHYVLLVMEFGSTGLVPAAWSTPISIVVTEPEGEES